MPGSSSWPLTAWQVRVPHTTSARPLPRCGSGVTAPVKVESRPWIMSAVLSGRGRSVTSISSTPPRSDPRKSTGCSAGPRDCRASTLGCATRRCPGPGGPTDAPLEGGNLQIPHRSRTDCQGRRHHRPIPWPTGQRDRVERRREVPDPGT